MNVDEGAAVVQAIRAQADTYETSAATLSNQVHNLEWSGADAEKYKDAWHKNHSATLNAIVTVLRDQANELERHVREQNEASNK